MPLTEKKPEDPLVGKILDGRYRVHERLGEGGVGAVYRAEHVETKRPVALKVLHALYASNDEFQRRFMREAQEASKLSHPSCVSVIDFGRVDNVPYLVMELVRGKSLHDRLDDTPGRRLPPSEAVVIARGVLSALRHAHGLGVVHRDVKPANVMLVENGGTGLVVKLLDFGLAKSTSDEPGEHPLTQAGMVFGTPGYLSPEQASGAAADARSDLYALGIVLYEMVAGRKPFMRDDPLDVVRDHIATAPPLPRSFGAPISVELEAAIMRALVKDPSARWPSAEAFAEALAKTPEVAGAPAPAPVARRFDWRPFAVGGGAAMATLALVLAVARTNRGAPASPAAPARAAAPTPAAASPRPQPPRPAPKPTPPPSAAPASSPVQASATAIKHLFKAVAYEQRLWCSDALLELDRAVVADARIAASAEVTTVAIRCLVPKTRTRAVRFLVERVGARARPALEVSARGDPNGDVRRGAEEALARLPP